MTAVLSHATTPTSVPTFSRLTKAEFGRLFGRRFVRVLPILAVLGFLIAMIVTFWTHARVSAADLAQATQARDRQIIQIKQGVAECSQGLSPSDAAQQCRSVPSAADFPPDQFLNNHPFEPARVSDYALVVGVAVALLAFLVGATFVGAEWSSKNMIAWLMWEPRRMRLMAAKLLALLSFPLAVSVLAQAAWFGTARARGGAARGGRTRQLIRVGCPQLVSRPEKTPVTGRVPAADPSVGPSAAWISGLDVVALRRSDG